MTSDRPAMFDVVVVGGGPAGAATALSLSARGVRVALVDRARFPRTKPCAEYLNPGATRLLDRLGVLAALRPFGPSTLRGLRIVSPSGDAFVGRFHGARPPAAASTDGCGLAVRREILDQVLVRAAVARGTVLLDATPVVALDCALNGTRAVAVRAGSGTRRIHGRLVVGADGLNSRIAGALGTVRRGRLRRLALVSHAQGVRDMQPLGEMHVRPWGYVGLAPVDAGLVNVSVVVDLERATRPAGSAEDWFHEMLGAVPAVAARLREARFVTPVLAVGPFARRTSRATGDRVLLVGDAADFYDPFTGDGIYAALRGASLASELLLGGLLEHDRLGRAHLARYDTERRRAFGAKWLVERLIGYAIGHARLMNHMAPRLAARHELADLLVAVTGGTAPAGAVLRPSFVWGLVR